MDLLSQANNRRVTDSLLCEGIQGHSPIDYRPGENVAHAKFALNRGLRNFIEDFVAGVRGYSDVNVFDYLRGEVLLRAHFENGIDGGVSQAATRIRLEPNFSVNQFKRFPH